MLVSVARTERHPELPPALRVLHTELNWDPRTNEDERSPENFWAAMENGLAFYRRVRKFVKWVLLTTLGAAPTCREQVWAWEWRARGCGSAASANAGAKSAYAPTLPCSRSPTPSDAQSLARVDTVFRNFFTDRYVCPAACETRELRRSVNPG